MQLLEFEGTKIRKLTAPCGTTCYIASDVLKGMRLANAGRVRASIPDSEKIIVKVTGTYGERSAVAISEKTLLDLLRGSRMMEAMRMLEWFIQHKAEDCRKQAKKLSEQETILTVPNQIAVLKAHKARLRFLEGQARMHDRKKSAECRHAVNAMDFYIETLERLIAPEPANDERTNKMCPLVREITLAIANMDLSNLGY